MDGFGRLYSFLSFPCITIWMACFYQAKWCSNHPLKSPPPRNYCRGYMGICDPSQEGITYSSPTKNIYKDINISINKWTFWSQTWRWMDGSPPYYFLSFAKKTAIYDNQPLLFRGACHFLFILYKGIRWVLKTPGNHGNTWMFLGNFQGCQKHPEWISTTIPQNHHRFALFEPSQKGVV